jgi:hypothetical protein
MAESRNINIANRTRSSSSSTESCPQCRDLFYFHLTQRVSGLSWTLQSPETLILQIELSLLRDLFPAHSTCSGLSWTLQSPEKLILQIELSLLLPQPNHVRNVEIYFQLIQRVSGLSWTLQSPETLILQIELALLLPQPNHVRNVEIYFHLTQLVSGLN